MNFQEQRVKISPDVMFREVGGELVLLDLKTENYFGLDEVGARVWKLIEEHGELQRVFERMLAEYSVDVTTLERDLTDLVTRLRESGLVEIVSGDG
jgi:hypothetical protein